MPAFYSNHQKNLKTFQIRLTAGSSNAKRRQERLNNAAVLR